MNYNESLFNCSFYQNKYQKNICELKLGYTKSYYGIGTLIGMLFSAQITHLIGNFLAFTAGTFIYLSASDLIPETHKVSNKKAGICLFVGVVLVCMLRYILGNH